MYTHILVPFDDSEPSRRGLDEAARLARVLGSRLHLLHVVDVRSLIVHAGGYVPAAEVLEDWRRDGEMLLAQAVERLRREGVDADSAVLCDPGLRVSDAILQESARIDADLVVMGTHGRRGLSRLTLGSDAEMVVRESRVPVLLVRAPA